MQFDIKIAGICDEVTLAETDFREAALTAEENGDYKPLNAARAKLEKLKKKHESLLGARQAAQERADRDDAKSRHEARRAHEERISDRHRELVLQADKLDGLVADLARETSCYINHRGSILDADYPSRGGNIAC